MAELERGGVYRFDSLSKNRMAVILTRQAVIPHLRHVTVVPATSTIREIPSEVIVGPDEGLPNKCALNCDHIMTLPKDSVGDQLTTLSYHLLNEIRESLNYALGFYP